MQDLGALGGSGFSEGHAINNSGQVTGKSLAGVYLAFLYSAGNMYDLNTLIPANSGWVLIDGLSINDVGQITGVGVHNGATRAFLASPGDLTTLSISMSRCNASAYGNLDSPDIDAALVPLADPNVLTSQPLVTKGLVADGVTPLLFKITLAGGSDEDKSATYNVQFDSATGGSVSGGIAAHLWLLKNGAWVKSSSFTFGDSTTAYAYIAAIKSEEVLLNQATELQITMHVTSATKANVTQSQVFTIRKPPVVLVHGYNSNRCAWSDEFLGVLKASLPDDFVVPIDYGGSDSIDYVCPGIPLAITEPLPYLAFALDQVVISQIEDRSTGLFSGWAITRYDVVGHSQGGVLLRMLCQNFSAPTQGFAAPFARTRAISPATGNRGRFRRVITIGSPQNGATLLRYASQLMLRHPHLARYIPPSLTQLLQPKFDPYMGQIPFINTSGGIDNRIKFNCVRTLIGQSTLVKPWAYKGLGLESIPPGESSTREKILLPQGSDGIVDFASQGAGASAKTDFLDFNISHASAPVDVFDVGEDQTQTRDPSLASKVEGLLNTSATFGSFTLPGPVLVPDQSVVDLLAGSLEVEDVIESLSGSNKSRHRAASKPDGSIVFSVSVTPKADDPPAESVSWYAESRNVNGITDAGITTTPDPNDSTKATVSVDDSVAGDVVAYASYISQKGSLVLGQPLLVISRPPSSTPSGIDLGQSSFALTVGDVMPVFLYADYPDGRRMPQFVGADETVTYQSSNSSVVEVDSSRDSLIANAAGTATVTVSFNGFTTQASVTVNPTTPPPSNLLNISTRMQVLNGDNVLIGGFIVSGSASKKVILRGIGPSLGAAGISGTLQDPYLELHSQTGTIASNENWKDTQQDDIIATGIPPTNDKEAAIVTTLAPGAYTVILRQQNGGTGIGLVEAYDLDQAANSKLANISTRGFVDIGNNVMIGGFIAGGSLGGTGNILVRAIGPSLTSAGVTGALQDPTLELHDSNGDLLDTNDNWKDTQSSDITATGIPPTDDRESAIVATLTAGAYTAIVRGVNDSTGVALVEAYQLDN